MTESSVLYRKYRPATFADVKNQEHIITVLEGAIKKATIPHALLFTGGRGTGKTTLARIFAHEIGTDEVDLYEMDAASNRGIDDIRELKEAVYTLPYKSKYKVYIIDEVHMLTKEAFNALLKTLEEPPPHVVFILATTEVEKVIDTILSRCQVFTMRAPSRAVLVEVVTAVAKKEGFTLVPAAAELIAVAADGSFRDALGVTQKVMMASGDTIGDADEVAAIIGAPKAALLAHLIDSIDARDIPAALKLVGDAVASQTDMKLFIRLILERVRAIMLLRNAPAMKDEVSTLFTEDEATRLVEIAANKTSPINSHLLKSLLQTATLAQKLSTPAIALELWLHEMIKE